MTDLAAAIARLEQHRDVVVKAMAEAIDALKNAPETEEDHAEDQALRASVTELRTPDDAA